MIKSLSHLVIHNEGCFVLVARGQTTKQPQNQQPGANHVTVPHAAQFHFIAVGAQARASSSRWIGTRIWIPLVVSCSLFGCLFVCVFFCLIGGSCWVNGTGGCFVVVLRLLSCWLALH